MSSLVVRYSHRGGASCVHTAMVLRTSHPVVVLASQYWSVARWLIAGDEYTGESVASALQIGSFLLSPEVSRVCVTRIRP